MAKKRKQRKKKSSKSEQSSIKRSVLSLLNSDVSRNYSFKQIARKLNLKNKHARKELQLALEDLETHGKVDPQGGYSSTRSMKVYTGKIDHISPRYGFIISEELDEDVYVSNRNMGKALDGDRVQFMLVSKRSGSRLEGKVIEIVSRSKTDYVGRLEMSPGFAFVVPDNKKLHVDFFIPPGQVKKAKNHDKVIVQFQEWPDDEKNPTGNIVDVLGPSGDNTVEMHSILAEFGLPYKFDSKITQYADKIPGEISDKDRKKRKDFRQVTTFTIDPEDAKDFDDALSFKRLKNGNVEVGIHIADVTHYVPTDSILDREAFQRATSVYLVDRTIPMLPERLSNQLCSLRPQEEKLTFSAVFEIDRQAQIKNQWFGRTVIFSDYRFTYEEAQQRIESKKGDFSEELTELNRLAKLLRKKRFEHGAVNFESVEVRFQLDENGKPLGIEPKVRKDAHKLIEEFMLLANKKVAEYIVSMRESKKDKPFVFRTHDAPDPEKVATFALFAKNFGHEMKTDEKQLAYSLNQLMDEIEGKPEQHVLMGLAIRSMAKAKYTTDTLQHYGLAFRHYTHFTSPIRRYPDMMVHRLLQRYMDQQKNPVQEELEDQCEHCSEMEKVASDAERASVKYKQVEFMESKGDQVFEGIVSGVTDWGIFVEIIETKCEGLVRISDLLDDYYEFDEKHLRVVGRHNKRVITLGDQMRVKVVKTDIDRRTIDLEFVDKDGFRDFT